MKRLLSFILLAIILLIHSSCQSEELEEQDWKVLIETLESRHLSDRDELVINPSGKNYLILNYSDDSITCCRAPCQRKSMTESEFEMFSYDIMLSLSSIDVLTKLDYILIQELDTTQQIIQRLRFLPAKANDFMKFTLDQ